MTQPTVDPWQLLASRTGFRNRWLHLTLDTVRLPNGQTYEYTSIHRREAGVAVAVLDGRNWLLLEREYRHPVGQVIYQLPGGLAGSSEDLAASIRRELQEETGLVAGELRHLGSVWNNPASSDGECHVFLCRDAEPGGTVQRDGAEFIAWDWYPLDWVRDRVRDGTIRDRVVICALAYLCLEDDWQAVAGRAGSS
jgi:ADP-ribose pyrophosphatase